MIKIKKNICLASSILCLLIFIASCSKDLAEFKYEMADELFLKGKYQKALKLYKYIVEENGDSAVASASQYKIGQIYRLYMNNDAEALKSYETLIFLYPDSREIPLARKDMAEVYLKQGRYQKAISEYYWLANNSRGREREQFRYEIALCYIKMSDTTQARIELEELLNDDPSYDMTKKTLYQIANTFYLEGRFNNAISVYDNIINNYPEDDLSVEAKFGKAIILEELNNLTDAIKIYKDISEKYTNKEVVKNRIMGIETRLKDGTGNTDI